MRTITNKNYSYIQCRICQIFPGFPSPPSSSVLGVEPPTHLANPALVTHCITTVKDYTRRRGDWWCGQWQTRQPLERVVILFSDAVSTLTRDDVWSLDCVITWQKHLYNLVIVVLSGQYQRRHIGWKLTLLLSSEERIILTSSPLDALLASHVVGMFYDHFNDLGGTLHVQPITAQTDVNHAPLMQAYHLCVERTRRTLI